MTDQDLLDLFSRADAGAGAGAEPPPSRLDANVVLAASRARARHRLLAVPLAAATAAGVVGATAVGVASWHQPAGPPVPSAAVPGWAAVPTSFDPLVQRIGFGWLPAGLTGGSIVQLQRGRQVLEVSGQPGGPVVVSLMAFPAGVEPTNLAGQPAASTEPAPDVGGHPAHWITAYRVRPDRSTGSRPGRSPGRPPGTLSQPVEPVADPELAWQYGPDAWAVVDVAGPTPKTDPRDASGRATAERVAATARLRLQQPIRLPFRVSGVPANLRPLYTVAYLNHDGWGAGLSFSDTDGIDPGTGQARELRFGVSGPVPARPSTNTTVDGHPALLTTQKGTSTLDVYGVRGSWINIAALRPAVLTAIGPGGVLGRYRDLHLVANPADRSGWTDHPIR